MARSVAANTEGLTFTGADIWVPRGPISRNEQFGIPTGYCSAVLRETTGTQAMAVAARAGSASPLCEPGVEARREGKDPPRLGSPRALCKNWRKLARLDCSTAAGSRPSRDGISQLPAPAGSQGQHESHADAPIRRISCRGGLPPPCTALRPASWLQPSGAAARISPRRSPNPASINAPLSAANAATLSAQSTNTAPAAVSASWPCALERRSRGASSWPHTARGFGALSR